MLTAILFCFNICTTKNLSRLIEGFCLQLQGNFWNQFFKFIQLKTPIRQFSNDQEYDSVFENNQPLESVSLELIYSNLDNIFQRHKHIWKKYGKKTVQSFYGNKSFSSDERKHAKEQFIIVSGPMECGKSSTAFHIAMTFEKTMHNDFVIISNPDDFTKVKQLNICFHVVLILNIKKAIQKSLSMLFAQMGVHRQQNNCWRKKAKINDKDTNSYTPLHLACKNRHADVVRLLNKFSR